jgi:hypothetical protein
VPRQPRVFGDFEIQILQDRVAGAQQPIGHGDAQAPGQVVVTTAREAQLARSGGQLAGTDLGQRFDRLGDIRAGQPEILGAPAPVTPASSARFLALRERPSMSASTMAARLGSASRAAAEAMRRLCMAAL